MKLNAFTRTAIKTGISAAIGVYVLDKFVINYGPNDPDGFVQVTPGFGMDTVATVVTLGLVSATLDKVI